MIGRFLALDSVKLGTLLGVGSAVGYTAANIALRNLANHCDPVFVTCIKAFPTLIIAGCIIIYRMLNGLSIGMPRKTILQLIVVSFIAQVFGNVGFQWALQIIGLALSVTLCLGAMMVSSAMITKWYLKEEVTGRTIFTIVILCLAICILSFSASDATAKIASETNQTISEWKTATGVFAVCLSGLAYSLLGLFIRKVVGRKSTLSTTLFLLQGTGVLILTVLTLTRLGANEIYLTTNQQWVWMILAGVFNAAAFFALSKAYQLTSLVHTNLLNASQAAMAALAGLLLFKEPLTLSLAVGVLLTIFGLVFSRQRAAKKVIEEMPIRAHIR